MVSSQSMILRFGVAVVDADDIGIEIIDEVVMFEFSRLGSQTIGLDTEGFGGGIVSLEIL
jgi:hypothetical protein